MCSALHPITPSGVLSSCLVTSVFFGINGLENICALSFYVENYRENSSFQFFIEIYCFLFLWVSSNAKVYAIVSIYLFCMKYSVLTTPLANKSLVQIVNIRHTPPLYDPFWGLGPL